MNHDDVAFGAWLPSAPDLRNPGCTVANNVVPTVGGYSPLRALRAQQGTVSAANRGAQSFFLLDGTALVVGGTETALFTRRSTTVVETGGLSTIGLGNTWQFARYNRNLIAVAPNNTPRYLPDLTVDDAWQVLPGSPPEARYINRVGDFLVLGYVGNVENRIQWSPFNQPTGSWTTDRRTQSGFADLPRSLGAVQGITGGRFPLVFQERGVSRIEPAGPPLAFDLQEVEEARGCVAPFSIVQLGSQVFYLATDGFYVTDGSSFRALSASRLTRHFFADADAGEISQIHGAIDWLNECIVWAYKPTTGAAFSRQLFYSWSQDRWASADVAISRLVSVNLGGTTFEDFGSTAYEDAVGSWDDPQYRAQSRRLGAFVDGETTSTLNFFDGDALQADFVTGRYQPATGRGVKIDGVRVWADNAGSSVSARVIGYDADDSQRTTAFSVPQRNGFCPQQISASTVEVAARFAAGGQWDHAQGVQIRQRATGRA